MAASESRNHEDIKDSAGRNLLPSNNGEIRICIPDEDYSKAEKTDEQIRPPRCFFADGVRRVDYVLAYTLDSHDLTVDSPESAHDASGQSNEDKKTHMRREFFQTMLGCQGLELENADAKHDKTRFVLIHAPWELLAKQAKFLRFKMPIRINDVEIEDKGCVNGMLQNVKTFKLEDFYEVKEPDYFTALFSVERADQFIMPPDGDRNKFFTSSQRSRIVYDLLIRTPYDPKKKEHFGIGRLLANNVYTAAYPLHEGDFKIPNFLKRTRVNDKGETVPVKDNDRQLLYDTWAKPTRFYKYQPLFLIKKYFGAKIGLYFAWLGFYTKVLFPAGFFGLFAVLYGVLSLSTDQISNELCNASSIGGTIMCPNCDNRCNFWKLVESCRYAKITHVFDNGATVIFAVFMSVWATLFIEGWKRYHAEIAWEWDLMDYQVEEEMIRPEFQQRVSGKCINPVTQEEEPYLPVYQKVGRLTVSGVSVVFFLLLVLAFVFGAIVYRIIVLYVLYTSENYFWKTNAPIITAITAAIINLIIILILSNLYRYIAKLLTNWECPRTQTEWDNNYSFKVFLFEFVNYYSSLFYIAFFKGKFSGVPGSGNDDREQGRYRMFGRYRMESCDPAGCMVELVIELAVIMVGRQFFESFVEIALPMLLNAFRNWRHNLPGTKRQRSRWRRERVRQSLKDTDRTVSRWERDYDLNAVTEQFLFDEYLEMVLQFGFVTLFVAAFPLAPLFALLNNLIEIRLDAYKFLVTNRRPMPARAENLGVWTPILDGISKLAVLTNACVIAFTSDFVPKILYIMYEGNGSYSNYINGTLSYYNASKLEMERDSIFSNVTVCRFRDYRKPPCSLRTEIPELVGVADCDDQYGFSLQWWHIFAAKVTFVLLFEHSVFLIKGFIAYWIPDLPTRIFVKLQREQYLARQARRDYEMRPKSDVAPDISGTMAAVSAKEKYATFSDNKNAAHQPGPFEQGENIPLLELGDLINARQHSGTVTSNDSFYSAPGPSPTNGHLMVSSSPEKKRFGP